jgi:site-specific recombinase XerD
LEDVHLTPDDAWLLVRGKGRKQRQVALGHRAGNMINTGWGSPSTKLAKRASKIIYLSIALREGLPRSAGQEELQGESQESV